MKPRPCWSATSPSKATFASSVSARRVSSRRSRERTSRTCSPIWAASTGRSGTRKRRCALPRRPTIRSRCTGGLFGLGSALLRRGDLPRAIRVVERCFDLCRTWQLTFAVAAAAAIRGVTYPLAGRAGEAVRLAVGAVETFRGRVWHNTPGVVLLYAGMTCLAAGRLDEAAVHAREALALVRQLGARAGEAHALHLLAEITWRAGESDADRVYRESMTLAQELAMRPVIAHCHFGLGRLRRHTGSHDEAREHLSAAVTMYREMGMQRWLEGGGRASGPGARARRARTP